MKKRILSLALGLALCLGLAAPAFAAVQSVKSGWDDDRNVEEPVPAAVKSEKSAWILDCPDDRGVESVPFKLRSWNWESLDEYGNTGVFTE